MPQRTQARVVEILVMDFGWNINKSIDAVKNLYDIFPPLPGVVENPVDSAQYILNNKQLWSK